MARWTSLLLLAGLMVTVNSLAARSTPRRIRRETATYSFTMELKILYTPEMANVSSEVSKNLSEKITPAAKQLMQTVLPDCTDVTLTQLKEGEGSVIAYLLATFPRDNHTSEEVQSAINQAVIKNSNRLGEIEVVIGMATTTAPPTTTTQPADKPGRKAFHPYPYCPRMPARSIRPIDSSEANTTSSPSTSRTENVRSTPSMASDGTPAAVTNPPTGNDLSSKSQFVTKDATTQPKPSGQQSTKDSALTGMSAEIPPSTTAATPTTKITSRTMKFKVGNLKYDEINKEDVKKSCEKRVGSVFKMFSNFQEATVEDMRAGSVAFTIALKFTGDAPSNQQIADFYYDYLSAHSMALGDFAILPDSIRVGDITPTELSATTPSPGANSVAITGSAATSKSSGVTGISGSQSSAMVTGSSNMCSTTSPNGSPKSTVGPSVSGITNPTTKNGGVSSDSATTRGAGLNSDASAAITGSAATSKSGGVSGISGSQSPGMVTGSTNGGSISGSNESPKTTAGTVGPSVSGVTIPTTKNGRGQTQLGTTESTKDNANVPTTKVTDGGSVTGDKSKTTSSSTTTTTTATGGAEAAESEGTSLFPVYGRVILGLLAVPCALCLLIPCLIWAANRFGFSFGGF